MTFKAKCATGEVYVDILHAFDSIVFDKMFYKLERYGICGKLLLGLEAFLQNRSQCVV